MSNLELLSGYQAIWIVVALVLLYMARHQAHQAIRGLSSVLANAMRMAARVMQLAERATRQRNKEVLLAAGQHEVEKELEREFHRVEAVVARDLQSYPAFHRNMSELITRIDEDYRQATEVPPSPPEWLAAVEAVAKIPTRDDSAVSRILTDIHATLDDHHKRAMNDYRKASGIRHALLKRMMPYWRKLSSTVDEVGKTIVGLHERARAIDGQMQRYEAIRAGEDKAERKLSSSSLTQFVVAGLVLLIGIGGAIINFNLIALPMSEMVGGGSYIGAFKTSNVAALVIILVEISMGLFLMESLRITRLFPVISSLDDRMRRRMIVISFTILFILAGVESALAFMRDRIAADNEALRQSLSGAEMVLESSRSLIPTIGQMVMGFILPFALTFVAIPLESFIHASRTLFGILAVAMLRFFAFFFRLLGNVFHQLGRALIAIYDLLIFPLLWIELKFARVRGSTAETPPKAAPASKSRETSKEASR